MARIARRAFFPLIGIVLLILFVAQVRSAQQPQTTAKPALSSEKGSEHVTAEGRVAAYPGSEVAVGADVTGVIAHVFLNERDHVSRGQLLADLAVDDLRASLDQARASIRESDADIALYLAELDRSRNLFHEEIGTKKDLDHAARDLDAARARRATATAEARRIEATIAKARVVSPIDGIITLRAIQPGESIERGATVARVADLTRRRIEAEVDEFDVGRVQIGQSVAIRADGFDGASWRGHIEEIPDTVVRRALKPEDPARLSDTRVLLAKIAFDEPVPLKLGQRVEVTIAMK